MLVMVGRNDAALLHQDARDHDVSADNQLAHEQRVELFELYGAPRDVLQLGWWGGHFDDAL